jgi:NADH-quinone oxidoreductase subunit H
VLAVLFLVLFFVGEDEDKAGEPAAGAQVADAPLTAGGYPVPALPAGGAVRGAAAPLEFGPREPVTVPAEPAADDDLMTTEERIDG